MRKNLLLLLVFIISAIIVGCDAPSVDDISQEEYDAVIAERDAVRTELDEIRKQYVPKEDYDLVTEERDRLKEEVEEYKKSLEEENDDIEEGDENTESVKDSERNSENSSVNLEYPKCPLSFKDCGFTHYMMRIESFKATAERTYAGISVEYTISGTTDNSNGSAYLKVYCYDADGYSVDTGQIRLSDAKSGEDFKIKGKMFVNAQTKKIEFDKP